MNVILQGKGKSVEVPNLSYDGGEIDVLWDYHEEAILWYEKHMGWTVKRKEMWMPDPRIQKGRMTHMGYGTWLNSVLTETRLPFHFATRGSIDPNIRWCWRTKHLRKVHERFNESGIRVTDLYRGPDGREYFDFWATAEGTRLTAEGDDSLSSSGFRPSAIRIGVKDIKQAAQWYSTYVGMVIVDDHVNDGYITMALQETMRPKEKMYWILEQLQDGAYMGEFDGPIRPLMLVKKKEDFFNYYRFLTNNGIPCGQFGGFAESGRVLFHFYDPDGNRLNVCHC